MKKLFALVAILGVLGMGATYVSAQNETAAKADTAAVAQATTDQAAATTAPAEEQSLHKQIKTKFIEGGPGFMASIL
ncbi:MAG TPA: MotA/TolQ/ExbB proton channel family protein, partial [Tenuifilaceae bacterium]|nr:MotA/TolQ/ExbB proton channel family protein [Tenuifilaceae bacterium]